MAVNNYFNTMNNFPLFSEPFYTYVLIDPRNGKIFYVGKGKGRRSEEHEKNVEYGKEYNKVKETLIKNILKSGNKVMDRVVGRFKTENEALSVESVLVKWVYGIGNLTNAVHGHQHKNIRTFNNLKLIKGLDIEKNIAPDDHAFTKELQIDSQRYDTKNKLIFLKKSITIIRKFIKYIRTRLSKKERPCHLYKTE